jgi:hypothetical protein
MGGFPPNTMDLTIGGFSFGPRDVDVEDLACCAIVIYGFCLADSHQFYYQLPTRWFLSSMHDEGGVSTER